MELQSRKLEKLYELLPIGSDVHIKGSVLTKTRSLVGRADSCDVVINSKGVSAIHAIIEVKDNSIKIYDMNSTNGTLVNGSKVVVQDINVGDTIQFANIKFQVKDYKVQDLPPVLDFLAPEENVPSKLPDLPKKVEQRLTNYGEENAKRILPQAPEASKEKVPYILYPLAADPKAEFSEYIFEDVETLYPIFKYDIGNDAIEILILHNEQIYSADYLPAKNGVFKLKGKTNKTSDIELPYLGLKEEQNFLEIRNGEYFVHNLFGYDILHLTDEKVKAIPDKNELINLGPQDIVKFSSGQIEIYVRRTDAPPKVAHAPIFRRDKDFKKYLLLTLLFVLLPMTLLTTFEVDKEIEKDKVPERIATILYKEKFIISKKDAVKKTPNKKKVAQKSPAKSQKKAQEKTTDQKKANQKDYKKVSKKAQKAGKKTAKKVVQQKKRKATKAPVKRAAKKPGPTKKSVSKTVSPRKSIRKTTTRATNRKFRGTVDAYKSPNFKSTLSSLLAKGGTLSPSANTAASSDFGEIKSVKIGGGEVKSLKTADIATDTGSLTGATVGKLATSKGAEGLSTKKAIFTAGIPSETVVLGSMDPDIIRRILREHIPQFRSCYQKELDATGQTSAQGVIPLNFVIGASGSVARAGVKRGSGFSPRVQKCVTNVLYGIRFPRPMGGGTVEVDQPMNFYPKRI